MENKLENVNNIIRHIACSYSLIASQYLAMNTNPKSLKLLSDSMKTLDVSIGMLMKLKNQNKIIDVGENLIFNVSNNNDLGVCGAIDINAETITLYVKPSTGEILYYDRLSGSNKVIDGLILKDAMTVIDDRLVSRNLLSNKYGEGAIGIIFCNNYAMVINSTCSAEKRNLDSISKHTNEFILIDLN